MLLLGCPCTSLGFETGHLGLGLESAQPMLLLGCPCTSLGFRTGHLGLGPRLCRQRRRQQLCHSSRLSRAIGKSPLILFRCLVIATLDVSRLARSLLLGLKRTEANAFPSGGWVTATVARPVISSTTLQLRTGCARIETIISLRGPPLPLAFATFRYRRLALYRLFEPGTGLSVLSNSV